MLAAYPPRPAGPAHRDGVARDTDLAARIRAAIAGEADLAFRTGLARDHNVGR